MIRSISPIAAFVLLVLSSLLAACSAGERSIPLSAEAAREQLIDRNWIDSWPRSREQRLHVYRFTPAMGGGVYQDRTLFRGSFELFTFEATGHEIRFFFPETHERQRSRYRIERIRGPKPFTHRLRIDPSPRGPETYYGYDEGGSTAPKLPTLVPRIGPGAGR